MLIKLLVSFTELFPVYKPWFYFALVVLFSDFPAFSYTLCNLFDFFWLECIE